MIQSTLIICLSVSLPEGLGLSNAVYDQQAKEWKECPFIYTLPLSDRKISYASNCHLYIEIWYENEFSNTLDTFAERCWSFRNCTNSSTKIQLNNNHSGITTTNTKYVVINLILSSFVLRWPFEPFYPSLIACLLIGIYVSKTTLLLTVTRIYLISHSDYTNRKYNEINSIICIYFWGKTANFKTFQ